MKSSCFLVLALMSAYCLAAPQIGGMIEGGVHREETYGGVEHRDPNEGLNDAKLAHYKYMFENSDMFRCRYAISQMMSYSSQVVAGFLVRVGYKLKSPYDNGIDCVVHFCDASILKFLGEEKITVNCKQPRGR